MTTLNPKKRILIAPLDWGLGHATRCLPIINTLIDQNYAVIVACTPKQEKVFCTIRHKIEVLSLFSYNINYSKNKFWFPIRLALQIPKIGKAIQKEHKWLQQLIKEKNIDIVISDNRFGLHSKLVPCIFITHQLIIKTPFRFAELLIQKINYVFIHKFSQVWVPDVKGTNALAGELSNPQKLPLLPIFYIGHLNRFFVESLNKNEQTKLNEITTIKALIMLSGPEPQRSLLEEKICKQLADFPTLQFVVLRGLPNNEVMDVPIQANIKAFNHLPQKNIKQLITNADFIIARSGYTTIMEVLSMQKKCIFIPTPGQTEQEYLAEYLHKKKFCVYSNQENFNLKESLQKAYDFDYQFTETTNTREAMLMALKEL